MQDTNVNVSNETATQTETPKAKTYTEDEYNKLKSALDKTNAENKKYKDEAKKKLSEDEQKQLELEEREKRYVEMETRLRKSELKASLSGEFSTENVDKLVNALTDKNTKDEDLTKLLIDIKEAIIDETTKNVKEEIRKNGSYIPNGGEGENASQQDFGSRLAKEYGTRSNKAMAYFDNLKKK